MQLCLAALLRAAQPAAAAAGGQETAGADANDAAAALGGTAAGADGWDAAAVVDTARAAPDGATRNQALALLAVLAGLHPRAALHHVMDVSVFRLRLCLWCSRVHSTTDVPHSLPSLPLRSVSACCDLMRCSWFPWQVVAVAGGAAAAHEDAHSTEVATDALLSVLPAWLATGRPAAEAVAAVVDAVLGLPPHRRLPLLAALLAALPKVRPPAR